MKHVKLFENFLNEGHSKMTAEEVRKILSVFKDDYTKEHIISLLCNDEGSTEDEIMQFLVDDLEIDPDVAAKIYTTADWFRLDYMAYCPEHGGDQGLYESNEERGYRSWKYDIKNKKAIPGSTGVMHEVGIEGFYYSKPDKDGMLDGAFGLSDSKESVEEDAQRRLETLEKIKK